MVLTRCATMVVSAQAAASTTQNITLLQLTWSLVQKARQVTPSVSLRLGTSKAHAEPSTVTVGLQCVHNRHREKNKRSTRGASNATTLVQKRSIFKCGWLW